MRRYIFGLSILGVLLTAIVAFGAATKDEAIARDHKRIEGRWKVVALEVNGHKAADEDIKDFSVVNGSDGDWNFYFNGQEIKGVSTIDPEKNPKTITFTPSEGEQKGKEYLGIYELGENTRKLCYAPLGKERPTAFSSTAENQQTLVTFERVKAK